MWKGNKREDRKRQKKGYTNNAQESPLPKPLSEPPVFFTFMTKKKENIIACHYTTHISLFPFITIHHYHEFPQRHCLSIVIIPKTSANYTVETLLDDTSKTSLSIRERRGQLISLTERLTSNSYMMWYVLGVRFDGWMMQW